MCNLFCGFNLFHASVAFSEKVISDLLLEHQKSISSSAPELFLQERRKDKRNIHAESLLKMRDNIIPPMVSVFE